MQRCLQGTLQPGGRASQGHSTDPDRCDGFLGVQPASRPKPPIFPPLSFPFLKPGVSTLYPVKTTRHLPPFGLPPALSGPPSHMGSLSRAMSASSCCPASLRVLTKQAGSVAQRRRSPAVRAGAHPCSGSVSSFTLTGWLEARPHLRLTVEHSTADSGSDSQQALEERDLVPLWSGHNTGVLK